MKDIKREFNCVRYYGQHHKKTVKSLLVFLFITSVVVVLMYNNEFYLNLKFTEKPPLLLEIGESKFSLELQELSQLMQENIENFEESHGCLTPGLKCGNHYTCGFGCQIHHRLICLMIAYALNRTLHHNYIYKWPYSQEWPDTFQHLTTRCKTRPNTLIVNLETNPPEITEYGSGRQIPFPLQNGILVPSEIHEKLVRVHKFPFLWWIGQFATYTMKLVPEQEEIINITKEEMGFQSPIVGIHVRRTDKIYEKQNMSVYHKIEDYVDVAESYFNSLHPKPPQPWGIFLASEDIKVFDEAKSTYGLPKWNIIGIPPTETTVNWRERNAYLDEIVRDVTLLSQCDFVVCGFSSNVCRLVYEMMQSKSADATGKVISLDFKYSYLYSNHKLNKNVLSIL